MIAHTLTKITSSAHGELVLKVTRCTKYRGEQDTLPPMNFEVGALTHECNDALCGPFLRNKVRTFSADFLYFLQMYVRLIMLAI